MSGSRNNRWTGRALLLLALGLGGGMATAQTITNFTPTVGAPGTQVTIFGTGLGSATQVRFNTSSPVAPVIISAGEIRATVPVDATTGSISVTAGATASSAASFTVAPRVDTFTPFIGLAGANIQINGANFVAGSNLTVVRFAGVTVHPTNVSVTAANLLFAKVPAGAVTGPITVSTVAGTNQSSTNFVVSGTAIITDFSPSLGPTGTVVTINGGDFTGVTNVTFNGTNAAFALVAASQISATVPTNGTPGPIRIFTPTGIAVSGSNFVVTGPGPILTSFSPTSGKAGDPVVITGLNFLSATNVTFNGTNASFGATSDTQINTIVPAGVTAGPIRINTPFGTTVSTNAFSVSPSITSFAPSSGAVGVFVFIDGENISGVTNVAFNGVSAEFILTGGTQLRATVPTSATTGPIRVIAPAGTNTSSSNFVVTASAPLISAFSPPSGIPGATVIITGVNFLLATNVSFNGSNATFGVTSDSQISATVPTGASSGPISVSAPGGTATTTNSFFLEPRLSGFTPAAGPVGTVVVITGTNLSGATSVTFTGSNAAPVAALFTNISATRLDAVVPTNAISGALTVTTPGGPVISTTAFLVSPRVDSFSPLLGPVGTPVTLSGHNLSGATSVRFNGVIAAIGANSGILISTTVPFGAATGPISVITSDGSGASATNFVVTTNPDLALGQTNAPSVVELGKNVTLILTVTNKGLSIATGVAISNALPASFTFVSATSSVGTPIHASGNVTCFLGVLTNGHSATVTITVTPQNRGNYESRATVTLAETDPSAGDNFSSLFIPVLDASERTLTIAPLAAMREVVVTWPLSSVNFFLQGNTNLGVPAGPWLDLANTFPLLTNQSVIYNAFTNEAASPRHHFRLRSP